MRIFILMIILSGCAGPGKNVYFKSTDILPAPFPGVQTLPPEKPKSKVLHRKFLYETEVDICTINYKNKQTELKTKIQCLLKSSE